MEIASEIPLSSAPRQKFTLNLAGKECEFTFKYNSFQERFNFDLKINGVLKISGRKVEIGADLIKPYRLGIGKISCFDFQKKGNEATIENFSSHAVRLYHYVAA